MGLIVFLSVFCKDGGHLKKTCSFSLKRRYFPEMWFHTSINFMIQCVVCVSDGRMRWSCFPLFFLPGMYPFTFFFKKNQDLETKYNGKKICLRLLLLPVCFTCADQKIWFNYTGYPSIETVVIIHIFGCMVLKYMNNSFNYFYWHSYILNINIKFHKKI